MQLRKNIAATNVYITALDERIAQLATRIDTLEDSLGIMTEKLARRRTHMKQRMVGMYKSSMYGIPPLMRIIFTSERPSDIMSRLRYFRELMHYDRMLLEGIASARRAVRQHRSALEEKLTQVQTLRAEKTREHAALVAQKENRVTLLEDIRAQKSEYMAQVQQLEEAKNELNRLIEELVVQKKKAQKRMAQRKKAAFAQQKGSLAWPVSGEVIKKFGKIVHPVYKTVTRNDGINIRAKSGAPVRCVTAGEVVLIHSLRGLGTIVIVNHFSEYSTIYANLGSVHVQQGDEVTYGTVLGTVREATSLSEAQLHFEIRKDATPLDPMEWLE
jgi:septal ring factor EnvC (AmiA/AmiB activator)